MSVQKAAGRALAANGQDSIFRLLYAPFTFLSTGNEGVLVDMLASAVGFLEGYSTETLEADAVFEHGKEGTAVARSQLKLVPYATVKPMAAEQLAAPRRPSLHQAIATGTGVTRSVAHQSQEKHADSSPVSRTVTIEQRLALPPKPHAEEVSKDQLEALLRCFAADDGLGANSSFEALIRETSSPSFTKLAVTCYSQTGLSVSSSAFKAMLSTLAHRDRQLAEKVALDYEFEMDLTSFMSHLPPNAAHSPPGGVRALTHPRQQSRLERIRKKKKS